MKLKVTRWERVQYQIGNIWSNVKGDWREPIAPDYPFRTTYSVSLGSRLSFLECPEYYPAEYEISDWTDETNLFYWNGSNTTLARFSGNPLNIYSEVVNPVDSWYSNLNGFYPAVSYLGIKNVYFNPGGMQLTKVNYDTDPPTSDLNNGYFAICIVTLDESSVPLPNEGICPYIYIAVYEHYMSSSSTYDPSKLETTVNEVRDGFLNGTGFTAVYQGGGQIYFGNNGDFYSSSYGFSLYPLFCANNGVYEGGNYEGDNGPYDYDDPYGGGGYSGEGGGEGEYDDSTEEVNKPDLPTISSVDTGFITLYNPSMTQLRNLATYMWSTDFFDNIVKLWADPMDVIIGLNILPVRVPDGGNANVKVGNVNTGVIMNKAASQFVTVDCGSISIKEYFGGFLDYSPYTKINIYLPYCGTYPLSIDDVMNTTINVTYHVDILSGSCVAFIKCGGSVLYQFSGMCGCSLPLTGANYSGTFLALTRMVSGAIGGAIEGGGIGLINSVGSNANNVINSKPQYQRSGSIGSMPGIMGIQKPYVVITRPRQCIPSKQRELIGYPSYISSKVGDLSGYTKFEDVHLDNITATKNEKDELLSILKGGVIL